MSIDVVTYLRNLASPDPYDERPTPHAKELYQAADEIETLRKQLRTEKDSHLSTGHTIGAKAQILFLELAALTKERDELKISNAFAHGEWRAVKDQVAALTDELNNIKKEAEMNQKWAFLEWRQRAEDAERQVAALTKEKNDWYRLHDHVTDELVSSQAREAKLRDAASPYDLKCCPKCGHEAPHHYAGCSEAR